MLKIGDPAPDFKMKGDDDKEYTLSQFKGKKNVVLCFYPFDFSPVCTREHEGFRDHYGEFKSLDTEVFGVSVDSHWAHKAFKEKLKLPFTLLSDFGKTESPKFDAFWTEKGFNKRVVVVVDKKGRIAWKNEFEILTCPDAKQLLEKVKEVAK